MASYTVYLDCSKSWEGYVSVSTTDDSANNRTYIECDLYAYKTDGHASGSNGACFNPSITIDSETFWGDAYTTEYTSTKWHASASKWVYHNSSTGAKTITISGSVTKVSGSPSTGLDGTTLSGSKNITLTTYTVIQTYNVYYSPGNFGSPNSTYYSIKTQGQTLTLSGALYTRTGYTQTGWASDAAGTVKVYNLQGSYTADYGTTLYPYWTANGYTITYNPGTYGTGSPTTQSKSHGTNITLKNALYTRTGYTQTGWATNAAGTNFAYALQQTYTSDAAITLYPYWEPNVYTLTINPNGGTMKNGITDTTTAFNTYFAYGTKTFMGNLSADGTYHPSNDPVRTGYTFNGYSFSGGSGQKNTAGETYYFMGEHADTHQWLSNNTSAWVFNGNYNGNVTATAQWIGNTYYVQYNANGATSGSMNNSTHTYGTAKNLSKNTYTKTNFTFIGWNTKADGTGTSYTNQQSVSTLTPTAGGTVQLYAQWGQATYTIVFDMNGGSATSGNFSSMICNRGSSYNLPTGTMVRSGYEFKGWSTSSSTSTATYGNGAAVSNLGAAGATVILYAVWKAKSIKIKYNSNNGSSIAVTYTYDATTSNTMHTNSWTYSGYEAAGWARSSTATSPDYYFGQAFTGDLGVADNGTLNLYVVWVPKQPWSLAIMEIYRSKAFVPF